MAEEQTEEAPKKKSKVKIIIILIILLLLIGGGVATYWWLNLRVPAGSISTEPTAQEEIVQEETSEQPKKQEETIPTQQKNNANSKTQPKSNKTTLNIVTIPTVTINLADKESIRYLKIGFDIELSTKDSAESLEAQKAKVRDSVIILLSSKTYADLATTEGKILVKNEIASRLNQILGIPRVVQIYFNEFVIN